MTYLDTLKMLAEAQVRHNPAKMMFVPGQRILQLIAVVDAAKAMRDEYGVFWAARKSAFAMSRSAAQIKFDVALASLLAGSGR